MPKFTVFIVITLFFSLQGLCQSYQQQKLMDLQYRRFMAMSANDTSLLSKYLADDLVYIHSNGSIDSKTSLLKGIASGNIHFVSIIAEKRTASIDGNFAWIYGTANLTFKINNSEMTIHNYISFIDFFRLNKQQWQEVAWQSAKINRMGNYDNDSVKPQASQSIQPSIY